MVGVLSLAPWPVFVAAGVVIGLLVGLFGAWEARRLLRRSSLCSAFLGCSPLLHHCQRRSLLHSVLQFPTCETVRLDPVLQAGRCLAACQQPSLEPSSCPR